MRILVTGGAGYVGSHTVRVLLDEGHEVVVVDDLSSGHRHAVALDGVEFVKAKVGRDPIERVLRGVECVMHFAASIVVPESVKEPSRYYANNLVASLALLDAMMAAGARKMVFSSSAAVYGNPEFTPITEDHPLRPESPYGETKRAFELALDAYSRAYDLRAVTLRYFNASGAHPSGAVGEDHAPETHLIPLVLRAAMETRELQIFGTDYPTPDGTAIRDYVHVLDLARAHVLAAQVLDTPGAKVYNLGSGKGWSVREVLSVAREVTGRDIRELESPRRPGDAAVLTASNERARRELGWEARFGLREIVESAWRWHSGHPNGFGDVEERL